MGVYQVEILTEKQVWKASENTGHKPREHHYGVSFAPGYTWHSLYEKKGEDSYKQAYECGEEERQGGLVSTSIAGYYAGHDKESYYDKQDHSNISYHYQWPHNTAKIGVMFVISKLFHPKLDSGFQPEARLGYVGVVVVSAVKEIFRSQEDAPGRLVPG